MQADSVDLNEMRGKVTEAADILKVMAHPDRLLVLCQLTQGEVCVADLQKNSSLSQSAFSQHLTVLRNHQLVKVRKSSQQVFYSLADPRVEGLIASFHTVFCR
ncbi:ArsR/SmtB family transcription factor [Vibrio astriarenae]|jgi:DNA-binding transcriptional ArsR family regulator|uniref:Metalloregulator ArsR/SmtB family transcription factor n=1 Tax=Vibrio agarivorans TaxID=153622 RepID=A0ABT7Y3K4_9VIBR|nr:metalloregulator ArsR/SmtB family transcription factor [Vibrio agarivorans]MDN2482618.1 metalloregulator ArsR/SmtB family transcription factor [Vibrio agarivorans]